MTITIKTLPDGTKIKEMGNGKIYHIHSYLKCHWKECRQITEIWEDEFKHGYVHCDSCGCPHEISPKGRWRMTFDRMMPLP